MPSTEASRSPRQNTPGIATVPTGPAIRSNSNRNGSGPSVTRRCRSAEEETSWPRAASRAVPPASFDSTDR
ncbi:hypothetical protein [Streptomyces sp. A5-4]|uniref:hypothetical protein n=1 Tax=Streptomyces sp. A5-4 TaxID=3384771 RepID=UPI003DA9EDC9